MFDNFKRAENVNTTDSESKELSGKLIITGVFNILFYSK